MTCGPLLSWVNKKVNGATIGSKVAAFITITTARTGLLIQNLAQIGKAVSEQDLWSYTTLSKQY